MNIKLNLKIYLLNHIMSRDISSVLQQKLKYKYNLQNVSEFIRVQDVAQDFGV